jgi:uncharacterized membrane protein YfcA
VHKDSWPLNGQEWFGVFFTALWILGCNCAGMGGGGTMVPLLRMIFNFTVAQSIAISNTTVAVSGFIGYVFNFKKRHPLKKDLDGNPSGTLMDYSIGIVILPMGAVGAAIGAIVGLILPEPIIIVVLTLILSYIFVQTALKLRKMRTAENEAFEKVKIE